MTEERSDSSNSRWWRLRRKTVLRLIILVVVLAILDTVTYFALAAIQKKRNLFYDKSRTLTRERIDFWLDNSYHPQLGWDVPKSERNRLGARRTSDSTDVPERDTYKLKMFGDSFTYGEEVQGDETIGAYVASGKNWDVLNFGVAGYGTDQAFLKYEMNDVKTEYTTLGILVENIGRVVSVYSAYYMREWAPPKPRFIVRGDGLDLVEAPVPRPEDAVRLLDEDFVRSMLTHDYWPKYYEDTLGAPARLRWPASRIVIGHFPFFWNRMILEVDRRVSPDYENEVATYKYCHLYQDPDSEGLKVLTRIVDAFVALARQRGEHPIILVLPDQFSVDLGAKYGKVPYQPLVDHLKARGHDYLDFGPGFREQEYASFFVSYNTHYSPTGNEFIADKLAQFIDSLDAAKTK